MSLYHYLSDRSFSFCFDLSLLSFFADSLISKKIIIVRENKSRHLNTHLPASFYKLDKGLALLCFNCTHYFGLSSGFFSISVTQPSDH